MVIQGAFNIGEPRQMSKLKDLTGQKFGKLTVIKRAENIKNRTRWECICECGRKVIIDSSHLRAGNTKSCGQCRDLYKNHIRLYHIWNSMKQRCNNKNIANYKNYGGRGIKVCDEWKEFEDFYNWARKNGYDENAKRGEYTIDRIDTNCNYEPSNCRFVTTKENVWNRRCTKKVIYKKKEYWLPELAEKFNIHPTILTDRLKRGWDIEKALTTPKKKQKVKLIFEKVLKIFKKIIEDENKINIEEIKNVYIELKCGLKTGFYSRKLKYYDEICEDFKIGKNKRTDC